MFTDSCGRVLTNYWFSSAFANILTIHNRQKMTQKHRSVNNVLWRVVAGRIRSGRGPDAARGPPVGHPCCSLIDAHVRRKIQTKEQNIIRTMLWTSKDYKETELLSRHRC